MNIAVVGAGLSGLMAARSLCDHGHAVTVLEKSRAPGGRCATRHGDAESNFDHGAQYFTHRDARLAPHMQQWREQGLIAPWTATIASRDGGVWSEKADSQTRWVAVPGMRSLGVHLAGALHIEYGVTIGALAREQNRWQLMNTTGDVLGRFDRVLLTVPAPQTLTLVAPHSQLIAARAAAVQMQPCIATMLVLERRPDVSYDAAFVNDHSVLSWVARNTSKPGRGTAECWVLHANPSWSSAHLEREPSELAALMTQAFSGLVPEELSLVRSVAHRWRYAIPANAPTATPDRAKPAFLAEAPYDAEYGLGAAGDWCVGGRVEGALLSGMVAAKLVQDAQ